MHGIKIMKVDVNWQRQELGYDWGMAEARVKGKIIKEELLKFLGQ